MAVNLPVPLKGLGPSVQAAGVPAGAMQATTLTISGLSSPAFTLRLEVDGGIVGWLPASPLITAPGAYALGSLTVATRGDGRLLKEQSANLPYPASGFGTFRLCLVDGNANSVTASLS